MSPVNKIECVVYNDTEDTYTTRNCECVESDWFERHEIQYKPITPVNFVQAMSHFISRTTLTVH